MPLNPNKRIESLEHSMLESDEEDCPFILSQRLDLISELESRPLGPSGRRLLAFLQTGEGLTSELEELLRRVCSRIKQQFWSPKDGFMVESDLPLDPDEILEAMPQEMAEEKQYEEDLKIGLLSGPMAGAESSLSIEPVPGSDEEVILKQ